MPVSVHILNGCRQNDRQCQKMLYDQYFSFLMGVCYRYVPDVNEARFLVNEGFFKILTRLDKYESHIPFEIWMRRVMINTVIDHFRKNNRQKKLTVLQGEPGGNGVAERGDLSYAEAEIEAEHLHNMLQQVPEVSRKVFNLFAIDGYSHKEIAELMQITEGTSKWHVSSARQILRSLVKKHLKNNELQSYAK